MFGNVTERLSRWMDYRRTVRELSNLSDEQLNDMGINRYDLKRVASRSSR